MQKLSKSKEHFVLENMDLVEFTIRKYFSKFIGTENEYEDILQEGYKGLITSAITFDETCDFSFKTHAVHVIKQTITNYIKNNLSMIHYPIKIQLLVPKYTYYKNNMYTDNEIIKLLNITQQELQALQIFNAPIYSLNMVINNDMHVELADIIPDLSTMDFVDTILKEQICDIIKKELENIDELSKNVYKTYIYYRINNNDRTLNEIANEYNISYHYTSLIIAKVNKRLKTKLINFL